MSDNTRDLFEHGERDACGTGFVAQLNGNASHSLLKDALAAVCNLEHRGAVSPDGRTSDGAGVLTQIPFRLLDDEIGGLERDNCAVAMLFFEPDEVPHSRGLAEMVARESDLKVRAWRQVPFELDVLGDDSRRNRPAPWQLIVERPENASDAEFDRLLYRARKILEKRAAESGRHIVVVSWSRRTIVYKGLVVPEFLSKLYPDLSDERFETAIALFHQRYSTNTWPSWKLAQPFSYLAHNGEINTVTGNVNRMAARESGLAHSQWDGELRDVFPIVRPGLSDSASLDDALSFLVGCGRDLAESMSMLVPEAYEARVHLSEEWKAFAQYHSALMEPWDGPASLVFSDGVVAGAALDRNGLRPLRFWRTEDRLVVGSEAGIVPWIAADVVEKGRLGPGEMLIVDTASGRLLRNYDVKKELSERRDWRGWAQRQVSSVGVIESADVPELFDKDLIRVQKRYGYGREHLERILAPMALEGAIPVGSMGDDTPLAVLSENPQRLYAYFRQRFAQVTNPAIDPLRERLVMSLTTRISLDGQLLDEEPVARLIEFESPVVSAGHLAWLQRETNALRLDTTFPVEESLSGLKSAVTRLCQEAEQAAADGVRVLILSDRAMDDDRVPVPMLLATSAVQHHLTRKGHGAGIAIVCDAGDVIEDHDVACLIGFGATLVHPWLAYESVAGLARKDEATDNLAAAENYRRALEKGLLKIMAKLGIADVNSYRGAQTFEALGVAYEVVERYFTGCPSRIGGATLEDMAASVFAFHAEAFGADRLLHELGIYRFRRDGEYHAFHPGVFKWLHKAVRNQDVESYQKYADAVDNRPPTSLRDLLRLRKAEQPVALDDVEPAEEIARRFCTQAMSFGSLSRETHELLAVAMNKLGGKSNSGEGGEEPVRLRPYQEDSPHRSVAKWHPRAGDVGTSAIKQIASARFGVTPDYLVSATQLEIKMAQGSKPGEGGQIPGFKVTAEIAATRRAQAGMPLISPPPHHDIYSIEDLAQLIYDLKRVNDSATVAVKLVSVFGVGTIATGVAKGYADAIQISGHDGGTGASPLGSIKHAGLPWELGLGEVQQRLAENNLRGRVTLRVDGGLKTGRDVVVAALLGAEEFGFGTAALVAAGCVMARQCHSNTCPVGVATQREDLRARFPGEPGHVISFMMFVAEHVRLILSELGYTSLDEVIGRVDLLEPRDDLPERARRVDLSRLLWAPDYSSRARRRATERNDRPETDPPLDQELFEACVASWDGLTQEWPINNRERSVGARLAGEIARLGESLSDRHFDLQFVGQSGQSFGAFCNEGMALTLLGEAQDYVGKGMAGGHVVVRPAGWASGEESWVIMGNTCAYGATGGKLFAAGRAGERLAVRNSGATVVVEGCGDHGCEYMTGGSVVVLGQVGLNFGAGMTGGEAYLYSPTDGMGARVNSDAVVLSELDSADIDRLRGLLEEYFSLTESPRCQQILEQWPESAGDFRLVSPRSTAVDDSPRVQTA